MANHMTSGVVSLVLALSLFAGMQAARNFLAASRMMTLVGGFLGSNVFIFLLTAVSNLEMEFMGYGFQSKLFPEVISCLLLAMFASGLVHRVCVTVCLISSMVLLYYANNIGNARYGVPAPVQQNTSNTKKRR